jgi:hypothetical protein
MTFVTFSNFCAVRSRLAGFRQISQAEAGCRIAWFSRISGPISAGQSKQIKPNQTCGGEVLQFKDSQALVLPKKIGSNPVRPSQTSQTQSNPVKPSQTRSNPVKPSQTQLDWHCAPTRQFADCTDLGQLPPWDEGAGPSELSRINNTRPTGEFRPRARLFCPV